MMNRRKFFGVVASVAAIAAVPAAVSSLWRRQPRPEIAAEFFSLTWIARTNARSAEEALRIAVDDGPAAFSRIKNERGRHLGEVQHEVHYQMDVDAWVVTSRASVVA